MNLNEKNIRTPSLVLPLLVLGVAGHASIAMAQSPGAFTPTGDMITRRYLHTATLLNDGRVMIVGGQTIQGTDFKNLSSAELYDPLTGSFSATGSMSTPRRWHTATLLADGRVLIVGGISGPTNRDRQASAEIYDPATGEFSSTGQMSIARVFHTATRLADGRVLIAGEYQDQGSPSVIASAEIYDPDTGTFLATGAMHEPSAEPPAL